MPSNNRRLVEYGYSGDLYSLSEESDSYLKTVIEKLDLKQGDRVLDLGCGTGNELKQLKKIYDARVFGVDISASSADNLRLQTADVAIADATNLPFKDKEFDFVHSKDMFVHIIDQRKFFKEVARILKDDGRLLLVSELASFEADEMSPVFHYTGPGEKFKEPVTDWESYMAAAAEKQELGYKISLPVQVISEEKCTALAEENELYKIEAGLPKVWYPKPEEVNWQRIKRAVILFQKRANMRE